jgi:hypothetical protein
MNRMVIAGGQGLLRMATPYFHFGNYLPGIL